MAEENYVEIGLCWTGWVTMRLNIRLKGYVYRWHRYTVSLPLEVFTQRDFVTEFIRFKLLFTKMTNSLFEPPVERVRGNVRLSSIAHWQVCGRLPIRNNGTFHHWLLLLRRNKQILVKVCIFQRGRITFTANFRWNKTLPPNHCGVRKLECLGYLTVKTT